MSVEPEGWLMDASPPSWDAEAKAFSFFLHKPGHERVLCILADAHRQIVELRATQKLNAGLLESNGSVLVGADDI